MKIINNVIVKAIPIVPRGIVRKFANKYIAGDKLSDAVKTAKELNAKGFMGTMDVLGEHIKNKGEAMQSRKECIDVLDAINKYKLDSNLSLKLTQLGLQLDFDFCFDNLKHILDAARKYNIFVRIDMEDSSCTTDTIRIFEKARDYYPNCGIVLQAYMRRTKDDAEKMMSKMKTSFRLCKGIYVEPEEIAFQCKEEVNQNYLKVLRFMFEKGAYVGIATHDDKLVDGAYRIIKEMGLKREEYEFQMLLGVRERLRDKILADGHRMRIYIPFGEHWYAYCVRRFKENPEMASYVMKALFTNGR
ncbi:MAG: proline dehydrogenase [Ignavibacteriae bacterium]|nr:MAG: proline dehydrogenase [Ignavibacteriota bacterium]